MHNTILYIAIIIKVCMLKITVNKTTNFRILKYNFFIWSTSTSWKSQAALFNWWTLTVDVNGCLFLGRWQAALFITPKKRLLIYFTCKNRVNGWVHNIGYLYRFSLYLQYLCFTLKLALAWCVKHGWWILSYEKQILTEFSLN